MSKNLHNNPDSCFILPVPDTHPVRYYNPSPLTLKESTEMHKDSLESMLARRLASSSSPTYIEDLFDDPESIESTESIEYDDICKIELDPARLKDSMVVFFESLVRTTGANQFAGAILLEIVSEEGDLTEMWLPKKCCSNLDLANNSVCVWDKIIEGKEEDGISFAIPPVYYEDLDQEN